MTTIVRQLPLNGPTMASFVREILSATGHLGEKEDFCAKATRLKGRVDELKVTFDYFIEKPGHLIQQNMPDSDTMIIS